MIGMTRYGIILLVLLQALFYAIPALILGLLLGQAAYIGVAILISQTLQIPISYYLTYNARCWPI